MEERRNEARGTDGTGTGEQGTRTSTRVQKLPREQEHGTKPKWREAGGRSDENSETADGEDA
jgi:hypothetical protein